MRKFLSILVGLFVFGVAFATGENVPTSKNYVDAAMATKQDTIPANDGAAQVLTNTGTTGEYGTQGVYDSTGEYATQTRNLVDAATMNAGVQNAINSEFQCIEWVDPNDHTSDCLLLDVFGQTEQSILPAGYTALEYIESTGTQYIDTGYKPNNLTNFEIKYLHTGWGQQTGVSIPYGCTDAPNSSLANFGLFRTNGILNRMAWGYNIGSTNVTLSSEYKANLNEWYIDKYLQNQMYINGTLVATSAANPSRVWNASRSIYLFQRNSTDPYPSKIRVAYVKIWEQNSLLHNMIPARRDSDGEIGMYDTVTNTFFTNAETGEFIAGPVMNLYLPSGN